MIKKQLFYLFYNFFCRFTLLVCGEKNILANLTNSQEPEPEPVGAGCFWLLGAGAGAAWKKIGAGAGAAWEKNQEPEPLEKKSGAGAGAAKKFSGSPALSLQGFSDSNLGGYFKNKQTRKQLFEQEYYCSNNCLSLKTIIISINCFIKNKTVLSSIWLFNGAALFQN